jgi:hypothetical protein
MLFQLKEILGKPINLVIGQLTGNKTLSDKFSSFKKLFSDQDESILLQKYLTFLANRAFFEHAGAKAGRLF